MVRDFDWSSCLVHGRGGFFQPRDSKDDVFISTIDDVEKNTMDDSFDADEHSRDVLDCSRIVVGATTLLAWMGWGRW